MSSLTTAEAPILLLDAGATELAVVADRVKLFSVVQQRLTADITQSLSKAGAGDVYTCAAWGQQANAGRLLLVGTQSGEVRCYDAARAELRWTVAGALDGAAAGISCAPDGDGTVVAMGRSGGAALLDLATGGVKARFQASKHPLSAVAALPGGLALVAGSGVALFDTAAGARVHKFTGHATPVAAVAASTDGRFILTAAEGERHVAVWNATPSKSGKRKHKQAAAQLALDSPAVQLAVGPSAGAAPAGSFHVAALTQAGGVWLFECAPAASGGGVESRLWARSAAGGGRALALALESADAGGASLVVVAGSTAKPAFQRLRVDRAPAGGDAVAEFAVKAAQPSALLGQQEAAGGQAAASKARQQAGPPAVVDAGGEGTVLASKVAVGTKRGAEQEPEEGAEGEDAAMAEASEDEEEGGEGAAGGPTFAKRLAALQLQEGGGGAAAGQRQGKAPAAPAGPLKADSLAVLLSQALQSGDRALLERCLAVRSEDVIRKTAARLGAGDAALFLKASVQRLQSAPARGEQLAAWIRALLLAHAGSLVAMAAMQPTLTYLYQLIEARLASYHPLLSLAGRLDVVLAHAQRAQQGTGAALAAADGPLVTVEVGPGDAVEVEDVFATTAAAGYASGSEEGGSDYGSDEDEDNDEGSLLGGDEGELLGEGDDLDGDSGGSDED